MSQIAATERVFLFLQGPHGPFFDRLSRMLGRAGSPVWRVGFNAGDQAFWSDRISYIPFRGSLEDWAFEFAALCAEKRVTDIVLYGDTRPVHAQAVTYAKDLGLRIHVFEEGYLRPYWVTYERNGTNGNSRLMQMSVPDMQRAMARSDMDAPLPPAHWGDMRQHIFYGALYHWFILFRNKGYRHFRSHRSISVGLEFRAYILRLLGMPMIALGRMIATARVRLGGFPYHLTLLQLEHDSAFQSHSPFSTMTEFLELVIAGFADGAPKHHHLVLKAHPLEDGRVNLRRAIKHLAKAHAVQNRVHFLQGGKLARLLDDARTAVTVNSTAAQQALWRGIPLKAFGKAVYAKREFCSDQTLAEFFQNPSPPDTKAYREYRRYLLETSQLPGGFYAARSRRQLLRHLVDMMLSDEDPYDALTSGHAAPRQSWRAAS